jgi:DNA replication protein DnaC
LLCAFWFHKYEISSSHLGSSSLLETPPQHANHLSALYQQQSRNRKVEVCESRHKKSETFSMNAHTKSLANWFDTNGKARCFAPYW